MDGCVDGFPFAVSGCSALLSLYNALYCMGCLLFLARGWRAGRGGGGNCFGGYPLRRLRWRFFLRCTEEEEVVVKGEPKTVLVFYCHTRHRNGCRSLPLC